MVQQLVCAHAHALGKCSAVTAVTVCQPHLHSSATAAAAEFADRHCTCCCFVQHWLLKHTAHSTVFCCWWLAIAAQNNTSYMMARKVMHTVHIHNNA
jgi:hypothetical protein